MSYNIVWLGSAATMRFRENYSKYLSLLTDKIIFRFVSSSSSICLLIWDESFEIFNSNSVIEVVTFTGSWDLKSVWSIVNNIPNVFNTFRSTVFASCDLNSFKIKFHSRECSRRLKSRVLYRRMLVAVAFTSATILIKMSVLLFWPETVTFEF